MNGGKEMSQTYITLNNGTKIPQFGMGVYMVPAGDATKNACPINRGGPEDGVSSY